MTSSSPGKRRGAHRWNGQGGVKGPVRVEDIKKRHGISGGGNNNRVTGVGGGGGCWWGWGGCGGAWWMDIGDDAKGGGW